MTKILDFGFIDPLKKISKSFEYTVPSAFNKDIDHFDKLRLDYILTTKDLEKSIKDIRIIRNEKTDEISDHYPITIELITID